mmetsp:Transcript_19510/g.35188  ORF Transcript_19510/g.35188 Transcript_19510/m.35188 type:complete len:167 (-) Transcript_19510:385-885(-)
MGAGGSVSAPPARAVAAGGISVCSSMQLPEGGRFHTTIEGRYITVFRMRGQLTAIDSVCYHAGGPVGLGDIEDINGRVCVSCPWHDYKIDVKTGERLGKSSSYQGGRMVEGGWKSYGVKQRPHRVYEQGGTVFVILSQPMGQNNRIESDQNACNRSFGEKVLQGRR